MSGSNVDPLPLRPDSIKASTCAVTDHGTDAVVVLIFIIILHVIIFVVIVIII